MSPDGEKAVRVIAICGSLRADSFTRSALLIALDGAREVGAETALLDLTTYDLVFATGTHNEDTYPADVHRLRKDVRKADGIIFGTPEYHGGFSGVLKNALDLMGFPEFEGKMLGLIGISAGPTGAIHALNSLRTVGRILHAWVIPQQASIPHVATVFDDQRRLINPDVKNRVKEVGRQTARFAYLHASDQAKEFLRMWEAAPLNPGGLENGAI